MPESLMPESLMPESLMPEPLTGGCLCGEIRYAVVPASALRITRGETPVFTKQAGTFGRHEGMAIVLNLWAESRPAWVPQDSTLPCHAQNIA